MEVVAALCVLATAGCFAAYVFAPITDKHAAGAGTRFQLADLFSLVVLWQYPLAMIQLINQWSFIPRRISTPDYIAGGALVLMVTGLWLGLVTTLSRRGVHGVARRFIIIAVATPLGIAASLVLLPFTLRLMAPALRPNREVDVTAIIVVVICLATGMACRATIRWALGQCGQNCRKPP